ncbi:MAG: BTAD domain-containing putative transcriptional regulator [Actinocatenispora sp.]
MDFSLLGPVGARVGGQPVPLGPPKQRLLLAVLLLAPGRVVPVERLYELLWSDDPPRSARTAVQVLVSRLRAALAGAGAETHGVRLVTREPGYRLDTDPERVDLHRFRGLVERAGHSDSTARRADLLRQALDLWQGPPLADVADEATRDRLCVGLTEQHLRALEDRIEADLQLGRHAELLPELRDRVAEQPLRQRLVGALMLALYRNGRQDDALQVYQSLRERLADELGLDPVPELRTLHEAVLRADPDPVTASWAPPGPAQLPPDPPGFVGRTEELGRLDGILGPGGSHRTVVVSGVAGVGKTALAVRWAHAAAARFPDGTLHADLRGWSGDEVETGAVLDRFLRALGVPGPRVPTDPEARVDLYRSMLADRRVLVLLDNARTAAQVRPLLPAAPGCVAVVTSRNRLASLVARDGARPIPLDLLDSDSAHDLIRAAVGDDRATRGPVLSDLVRLCDRLPLALRIAAGRLAVDPACTPESLARDLASAEHRLTALHLDEDASVAEAFAGSYRALPAPAARLFRLVPLAPGDSLSTHAAAALVDLPRDETRRLLTELASANLLLPVGPDRFTMHDLVRAYARQRLTADESTPERDAALRRLAVTYLDTALRASRMLGSSHPDRRMWLDESPAEPVRFGSSGEAMRWLDDERDLLVDLVRQCGQRAWPAIGWRLAHALFRYHDMRGRRDGWLEVERIGLAAAQATGDGYAIGLLRREVGTVLGKISPDAETFEQLGEALRLHQEGGDEAEAARDRSDLGLAHFYAGDYARSREYSRAALDFFRESGDTTGLLLAINNLAIAQGADGQLVEAVRTLRSGTELAERTSITRNLSLWGNLANAYLLLGDHDRAHDLASRARRLHQLAGDVSGEANALRTLAETLPPPESHTALQEALRLYRSIGSPTAEEVRARLRVGG